MNVTIANEVYTLYYSNELPLDKYLALLQRGIDLLERNPNTDKLFISRFYKDEDLSAVNIALRYNQEVMVKFLMG